MAPPELNKASPKQKNLDEEVREMISALTGRLGSIQRSQKPGSSSSHNQNDDVEVEEQGVRIITLAGSNLGATMRGDADDNKATGPRGPLLPETDDSPSSYVVNSNFQAINNSIMIGGSYKTNDPGVHLDITDYADDDDDVAVNGKKGRRGRRGSHGRRHHAKHSDDHSSTDSDAN